MYMYIMYVCVWVYVCVCMDTVNYVSVVSVCMCAYYGCGKVGSARMNHRIE